MNGEKVPGRPDEAFAPGFRISLLDGFVLLAGAVACACLWPINRVSSFLVAFVVMHFFLFCNVFRIRRKPELIWAATFVPLAGATLLSGYPGWVVTAASSLFLTGFLVAREVQHESYHGICWKRWNPGLPEWWAKQQAERERSAG